jgi:NlpC/P60 family putative phage cell wall peptidase
MIHQDHIIRCARGWIGTPYRHQASLKHIGCDCLGLVRGIWREIYGAEPELPPPYAAGWAEAAGSETLALAARRHMIEITPQEFARADLLLFRWRAHLPAKHAGIATSAASMVHAQDGITVTEITLTPWWKRRIAYAFRFPERTH